MKTQIKKGIKIMTKELWHNIFKVSVGIFALSALLVLITAFTPIWSFKIATGALLGAVGASLSFLFLGIVVAKAVEKDEKNAKMYVQASYTGRLLFMGAVIVLGIVLPFTNGYATAVPFILIRPVVMIVNFLFNKKNAKETKAEEVDE